MERNVLNISPDLCTKEMKCFWRNLYTFNMYTSYNMVFYNGHAWLKAREEFT